MFENCFSIVIPVACLYACTYSNMHDPVRTPDHHMIKIRFKSKFFSMWFVQTCGDTGLAATGLAVSGWMENIKCGIFMHDPVSSQDHTQTNFSSNKLSGFCSVEVQLTGQIHLTLSDFIAVGFA